MSTFGDMLLRNAIGTHVYNRIPSRLRNLDRLARSLGADVDFDFTSGVLDSRLTYSRNDTVGTYFDSAGVLQTASANQPRFDHDPNTLEPLGLLIEESRTNYVQNSMMDGAAVGVVGSGGSLPTGWVCTATGMSREIVSVAADNSYVDLRISGTTGSTWGLLVIETNTAGGIANGQKWAGSLRAALVGGDLTNVTSMYTRVQESDGSSTAQTDVAFNEANLWSTYYRYLVTRTLTLASPTSVALRFEWGHSAGVAVDFTIRLSVPQLEIGAFATSSIPTTTAAATRQADALSCTGTNFSSWYRQDAGTFYAKFKRKTVGAAGAVLSANDTTADERILLTSDSADPKLVVTDGGVEQVSIDAGTVVVNTEGKIVGAYSANSFASSFDGGSVGTDTSGTLPTITQLQLGNNVAGEYLNGHLYEVKYWRQRIPDAALQVLTS